ncbi:ATP-dependent zinc metalloprotease FtsH [Dethiobacter alkaliphilus]|uniref:ATP-dependent zinc metalloprotease FtsH n=1 Tax=Dethiobacter alkaliphilus AHT 1 TaxID=555088 RepID=C0GJ20_DETAL|nr:ATP-dependent zinc metalloprotease FtsH [Dethiobacter alkaliphilus]EEG76653.1 ATP-dependent metalloprotease FtsH [Dethiobacter alkaliphilus AHT 1]
MNRFVRQATFYLLILLIAVVIIQYLSAAPEGPEELTYTRFIELVEAEQVERVEIEGREITGELRDGTEFQSFNLEGDQLFERLEGKGIEVTGRAPAEPAWWASLATFMIPLVIIMVIFFLFMQQSQGGGNRVMNFGKSKARLHDGSRKSVTFNDVAGADEEKAELVEIVEFLKEPRKFIELGARIPKGVLLVGPPGTGKTLIARAVAGEAGVPFFSISGSDFVEMFVGVGASRVRDLFENAKKSAPCIIFIDEIDAVGRQRGAGLGGGHDEREQTLNQLLVEMDGFDANEGIIIIAATNRPDILDPALLRPGRFDRQVTVTLPDVRGREEILGVHARNKPLQPDVDLSVIARRSPGFSGADLENVINEGALLAGRRSKKLISMSELEEAIERVVAGTEKKSRVISDFEKKIVAYHEAGHALVGYILPNTDPVHKVSIIPRGRSGGYTLMLPEQDRYYMTKSELVSRITTLLGGRVAEKIVLDEISTGAQNDLERATSIVRQMIMEYGMSDELGPITLGRRQQEQVFLGRDLTRDRDFSEDIARAIDMEIRATIDASYKHAEEIITNNRDKLNRIAEALMDQETLDAVEIAALIEGKDLSEVKSKRQAEQADAENAGQDTVQSQPGRSVTAKSDSVSVMINEKKIDSETNKSE